MLETLKEAYKEKFEAEGMIFKYIEQKNEGLGGAINTGLKFFSGEYLCWGDTDDFWFPESFRLRKEFLDENPEYGSISSNASIFYSQDLTTPIGMVSDYAKNYESENQFVNHLCGQPIYCPGCHMLRSSMFLDVNPERRIYPAKYGQNNQMLMPIYYKYPHKFLDVPLYGYVIYQNSMSHQRLKRQEAKKRINEYYLAVKYTIQSIQMPNTEKKRYLLINERKRIDSLIDLFSEYHSRIPVYYYGFLRSFFK